MVDPIFSDLLDAKSATFSFDKSKEYKLDEIISNISSVSNGYLNSDFFNLYLSHQSDSMVVSPLSTLSHHKNFNIVNGYSDRPYYDNKYINHISLKIKKDSLKKNALVSFPSFVEANFYTHFLDIILSKAIGEAKSKGHSYLEIVEGGKTWKNLKDIQASLGERNFFGITLLNQVLFNLDDLLKDNKLKINISNQDIEKEEFLKELFISSSNPSNRIEFNHEADISAQIYYSNGLEIDAKLENLEKDDFFTAFTEDELTIEDKETTQNSQTKTHNYFREDDEYFYIKIPIKMVLSLPINKEGKVDSDLFIPYGIDSNENDVIDIVTTGGAEHNRALAHLINKHRLEYKEERIFGFMDNKYDMKNLIKFIGDGNYTESFLMGLNQPVSGYNAIFSSRVDDEKGESANINALLLGYRLKNNSKIYNIVSIYGFSALASVFGMNYLVAEMIDKSNFNTETLSKEELDNILLVNKGIFQSQYLTALSRKIDIHSPLYIAYINKGLSGIISYKDNANSILDTNFSSKANIFAFNVDKEMYKKSFLEGRKESIVSEIKTGQNTTELKVKQ